MDIRKKIAGLTGLSLSYAVGITALGLTGLTFSTGETRAQSNIDEIIVTARKRDESLQDVPIAVSALSPAQLERGAIQTTVDLEKLVPNVKLHTIAQAGAALGASIRGMGFDDLEKTYEPTVGISLDGVFMASNAGAVVDFFDIGAIEVLRGPQGTLFGRNTIAGVINIKRSQPTGEWGGKFEATLAEHAREDFKAIVNLPLGDRGGVKIALRDLTSESYVYNITRGETSDFQDSDTASLSVKYDFTDQLTATFTVDAYNHETQVPDIIATNTSDNLFCGAVSALNCRANSADISAAANYNLAVSGHPLISSIQGKNMALNAEYDSGDYTIKSITGTMEFEELMDIKSWGAPGIIFPVVRDQEYEQRSQEFQLISNFDGPLNFVAGLYYLETDAFLDSGPTQNFQSQQDAEAQAIFGEVIYDLSEDWSVTAGARYTEEEKDFNIQRYGSVADRIANTNPTYDDVANFTDDNLSYRLVVQRNIDVGMVYASYSTGYRSGGFNARGADPATIGPFQSEEVESLELGLRAEPTDNLLFNFTVFTAEYTDKQEQVVTGGDQCGQSATDTCTFIRNAGEVSIEGVEIETIYRPTENLTIRGNLGLLDAEYDTFLYNGVGGSRDISGDAKVVYAPEVTGGFTIEHLTVLQSGELLLSGSFNFTDDSYGRTAYEEYNFSTGPDIIIDAYETLDLSATYTTMTDSGNDIKLVVYGTDVLEEGNRINRLFDADVFAWGELVPRRQWGITLGLEF